MKQVSKFLAAATLSVGLISSASAAVIFDGSYGVGTNSYIGVLNGAAFDAGFFNNSSVGTFANPISGAFTNTWVFNFIPGGSASVNANFNPSASILGFTVNLFAATAGSCSAATVPNLAGSNQLAGTCTGFSLSGGPIATGVPGMQASNIGFTPIASGLYAFVVTGTVNSTPALYSGQLNTTNVPEPGSLALAGIALAGLGLSLAKRKKA